MRNYPNTRPSEGVAYKPWVDRVQELLSEKELKLPEKGELISYYHNDLSYQEVLYKVQFKNTKNVWMELNVKYDKGLFNMRFQTSEQAKDFFKKFPELREELK